MLQQFYPFLASLGWAIINSLWQCALLWIVYKLVFAIHNKATPREKNVAASFLLFVSFGWFMLSFAGQFNYLRLLLLNGDIHTAQTLLIQTSLFSNSIDLSYLTILYKALLPYLSILYLFILLILSIRLIWAYRFTQKLTTVGLQKTPIDHRIYVRKVADWLGIKKEVKVYISELIDVPATIGYLKPVILLPVATFNHLNTEQAEAILLHELAHISRNDYLINILVSVVETILFFNPFARLFAKIIRTEREHSCDDLVLQFGYRAKGYAEALLRLEHLRLSQHHYVMAATGKENELLSRIKRILNMPYKESIRNQFALFLFVITIACLFSLAWTDPVKANKQHRVAPSSYLQKMLQPAPENTSLKLMPDVVLLENRNEHSGKKVVQNEAQLEKKSILLSGMDDEEPMVLPPTEVFVEKKMTEPMTSMQPNMITQNAITSTNAKPLVIDMPAIRLKQKKDTERQMCLEMLQARNEKFVWDFEADKQAMDEYQRSIEELQKSVKQDLIRQKKQLMKRKLEELNTEYELKTLQSVDLIASRFNFDVNANANLPAYIEIDPMIFLEQEQSPDCNEGSKKDVTIKIFKNGTVIVTLAEEGNVNSKFYTIERKKSATNYNKTGTTVNSSYRFQIAED
jgi:beta-lactamase regulating signal transducer with metallopeptidase domain